MTARVRLTRAMQAWSRLGAVWPAARVQLALARALHDDDPAAAAHHAALAFDVFDPLGSPDEIEQSRAFLPG